MLCLNLDAKVELISQLFNLWGEKKKLAARLRALPAAGKTEGEPNWKRGRR